MKNFLIVLVVVAVLGGGYLAMSGGQNSDGSTTSPDATLQESTGASSVMEAGDTVKEFTLDSFEFGYDQKTLTVNRGDTVTITLTNSGKMMHDFVVDEFTAAKTKQIKNGETDSISFVADRAGTFEYYCSVGQHRANGMVGTLIVQ